VPERTLALRLGVGLGALGLGQDLGGSGNEHRQGGNMDTDMKTQFSHLFTISSISSNDFSNDFF